MSFPRFATVVMLLFCCAAPAGAQAVKLEFRDGHVNLTAQNAPVRSILQEWARLGGTQLINADKVGGPPLTLQLNDVPEVQALDIILRGNAGYIVGQRATAVTAQGQSSFDRIMIVATAGTAAVATRPAAAPPPPFRGVPAFGLPQPQAVPPPDPDDDPASDVPPDDDPPQRGERRVQPGGRQAPPQPFEPGDDAQPQPPAPTNPFGVQPGSARPGVITPVPQPPRTGRSGTPDPEP